MEKDTPLEELVTTVLGSAKYRHVSPDFIRRVGKKELAIRRNMRQAVKATKSKLHQVGGAYFETKVDYPQALELLQETAVSGNPDDFRRACCQVMSWHASTRERLDILQPFYATTLAGLPPVRTVLDVACGFNPLAWPWMPFGEDVEYIACDIYVDLIQFIQRFMAIAGMDGRAEVRDVISRPPEYTADLALILKSLPCLEQVDKTAASHLLDTIQARYLLVSFPARSLGGRRKGMVENYEAHFHDLVAGRGWSVERFQFETELAFLVETKTQPPGTQPPGDSV